jgi:AcrR family transcriptional regulator
VGEPGRKRAKRSEREAAILEAALQAFSEDGYAGASLKRIATAAGLASPQLLAWYFPSKRDLYTRTLLRYAAVFSDLTIGLEQWENEPEQYLERLARRFLETFADPKVRMAYRLILRSMPAESAPHVTDYRPENLYSVLDKYLQAHVERRKLVCDDTSLAARSFVALLWGQAMAMLFPMLTPEPPPDDVWARHCVELFLHGMVPKRQ